MGSATIRCTEALPANQTKDLFFIAASADIIGTVVRSFPMRIRNYCLLLPALALPPLLAGTPMPVAQQNSLIARYCAVCHTDAARNGGLTLEHFDAQTVAPSLAAMLTSKLTGGALLHTAQIAAGDAAAGAYVAKSMMSGAMGAAGLPIPDKATITSLIDTLAARAARASEWHVERGPVVTASILRELPSAKNPALGSLYRLVVTCDESTRKGEMQLSWSPVPQRGTLLLSMDGKPPAPFTVEGNESMGNGSGVQAGPAAINLMRPPARLPVQSARVSGLFEGEAVTFPFDELSSAARQSLGVCFGQ
jgi:hypothetical protein